ncbi:MAG: hypothetical protein ISN64_03020 [Rickettsia sp.]|nr:hypothetical protein [Rickettsia sp.]
MVILLVYNKLLLIVKKLRVIIFLLLILIPKSVLANVLLFEDPSIKIEFLYKNLFSEDIKNKTKENNINSDISQKLSEYINSKQNTNSSFGMQETYKTILLLQDFFPFIKKSSEWRLKMSYRFFYFFTLGGKFHQETLQPIEKNNFLQNNYSIFLSISNLQLFYFALEPKINLKLNHELLNSHKINNSNIFYYKPSLRFSFKKSSILLPQKFTTIFSSKFAWENIFNPQDFLEKSLNKISNITEGAELKKILNTLNIKDIKNSNPNFTSKNISFAIGIDYENWYMFFTKKYKLKRDFKSIITKYSFGKKIAFAYINCSIFFEKNNLKEKINNQSGADIKLGISF